MDINRVRKLPEDKKTVRINIRATPTSSEWIKNNNVSPQLVFDEALKELMEKIK